FDVGIIFYIIASCLFFFFSSRRRHTRSKRDWSSDVCSSDLHLDAAGEVENFHAERALVRSRARLDYEQTHQALMKGQLHSSIALLPEVGQLRQASSLRRHAISLRLLSQSVVLNDDGQYELIIEPRHEIMDYNSEISLLTGMCAGQLMAEHGVGFLRTLPAATSEAEGEFRRGIAALGYDIGEHSITEFLLS